MTIEVLKSEGKVKLTMRRDATGHQMNEVPGAEVEVTLTPEEAKELAYELAPQAVAGPSPAPKIKRDATRCYCTYVCHTDGTQACGCCKGEALRGGCPNA